MALLHSKLLTLSQWILLMLPICLAGLLQPRQTVDLRIVALGDSITFGWWSNDLNGYRQDLALMLQHQGYEVEYVGFVEAGNMINNKTEGFPGATIDQIHQNGFEIFNGTYPTPNVVLLHAGTNDANNAVSNYRAHGTPYTVQDVANQMINDLAELLNDLIGRAPNSLVVLAQIISDADSDVQDIISLYNQYIPNLIPHYPKVIGVSMANVNVTGPDHDSVFTDDPTHPGNLGFQKMAGNFYLGIIAADNQGLISPAGSINAGPQIPIGPSATNPSTRYAEQCDYYPGWSSGSPVQVFQGPPLAGGSEPAWAGLQPLSGAGGGQPLSSSQYFYLADINNDGLAEYLVVDSYIGTTHGWRNTGSGWQDMGNVATGSYDYEGATIKFADMNADGFADYLVHNSSGVYLNYNYYGNGFIQNHYIDSNTGSSVENTYFADLNGDGRADLIWVDGDNVHAWLNTGQGTDISWDKTLGVLATGATGGAAERFFDIDGDGRADWIHVNDDSSMVASLNPDLVGYGAPPSFSAATTFAPKTGDSPANVTLGDINGDGRADVITVTSSSGNVQALYNPGIASSGRLILADADGDGFADAWLIDNLGGVQAWQNADLSFHSKGPVFTGTGSTSRDVHMADMNADGFADLIVVTASPGACTIDVFPGNGNFGFGGRENIWQGSPPQGCTSCSQLQFYDNNGDGRDDILCVTPDATAWLTYNYNSNPNGLSGINWQYFGWVLINQQVGRNQARFVDLNGDGQGDVMTLDGNGGIHAFISNTASAVFGGVNTFNDSHKVNPYEAVLADLDGDSRADYLVISPSNGSIAMYHNDCVDKNFQQQGYPRKPFLPRPGSPGPTLVTGQAMPTFTVTPGEATAAGEDDSTDRFGCNIRFESSSLMQIGSFFGHQEHTVRVRSADNTTLLANFQGGCSLYPFFGFRGDGCPWQRQNSTDIDGYTVQHIPLSVFNHDATQVNITGRGCDGVELICTVTQGQESEIVPVDPPVVIIFVESDFNCVVMDGSDTYGNDIDDQALVTALESDVCSGCTLEPTTLSTYPPITQPSAICGRVTDPAGCTSPYVTCHDPYTTYFWPDVSGFTATVTDYSQLPTESTLPAQPTTSCSPTPAPTAQMEIGFSYISSKGYTEYYDVLYGANTNALDFCSQAKGTTDFPYPVTATFTPTGSIPYPTSIAFGGNNGVSIVGHSNCVYTGAANAPGSLECDNFSVSCVADARVTSTTTCNVNVKATVIPKVQCLWS